MSPGSGVVRPAALVMARAPRPGQAKTRLEPLLGSEGAARLQAGLIRHSTAWASAVAPGAACVAFTPPDAGAEIAALAPPGIELFAQAGADLGERLAAASAEALERHGGPLLVVGTDLATLAPAHADAALAELAAGRDAVFGPARDGGYWLVGLARPAPELFALPGDSWGGPRVLELSLAAAAGLEAGLLGEERDIDEPEDVRAALAAGGLPADLRALLEPASSAG